MINSEKDQIINAVAEKSNTPCEDWEYCDGPETGVGSEHWLNNTATGDIAYVCNDQGHITISITPDEDEY